MSFYFDESVSPPPAAERTLRLVFKEKKKDDDDDDDERKGKRARSDNLLKVDDIEVVDPLPHKLVIPCHFKLELATVLKALDLCYPLSVRMRPLEEVTFCKGLFSHNTDEYVDIVFKIRHVRSVCIQDNFFSATALTLLGMYGKQLSVEISKCKYEEGAMYSFIYFAGDNGIQTLKIIDCKVKMKEDFLISALDKCWILKKLHIYYCGNIITPAVLKKLASMDYIEEIVLDENAVPRDCIDEFNAARPDVRMLFVGDPWGGGEVYDKDGVKVEDTSIKVKK